MRVRYTERAAAEIRDVYSYIAAENPSAAEAVLAQVRHTVGLIAQHPKISPVKYRGFVRMLPLRRFPQYLLFYSIEAEEIVVLNLRHASRRRPWQDDPG